jgi:hypothetical protein
MINDLLSTGWFEASILFMMFLAIMLGLGSGGWALFMVIRALIVVVEERFFGVKRMGPNRRVQLYSVSEKTGEICVRHPLSRSQLIEKGGKGP